MISKIDRHTFRGKRRLGTIDLLDFILPSSSYIGADPLYLRYSSVESVVKKSVPAEYQHFFALPDYNSDKEEVMWFVDDWKQTPQMLSSMSGKRKEEYEKIKASTLQAYKDAAARLGGEDRVVMEAALTNTDDDNFIFCADGKVYAVAWGMLPDNLKHTASGTLVHDIPNLLSHNVTFEMGEHGSFKGSDVYTTELVEGYTLVRNDLPTVAVKSGWKLKGWTPNPVGTTVDSDLTFKAIYEEVPVVVPPIPVTPKPAPPKPEGFNVVFNVGENGTTQGSTTIYRPAGYVLTAADIPLITPAKGFNFSGWNFKPEGAIVDRDLYFNAMYEKKDPWYKRLWLLLLAPGCLWWLLGLLLAGLILFLVLTFLRIPGCSTCHREVNGVVVVDGGADADFGHWEPIKPGDWPKEPSKAAPIVDEDGKRPDIVEQPGAPSYLQGRLILFMEDENGSVEDLARAFKREFPGNDYNVIGYDTYVRSLFIQVPGSERDVIRETINQRIPEFNFLVFDDEVYNLNQASGNDGAPAGWHLEAVKAQQGWAITKGNRDVVVAVIDDGIDPSHKMFEGRIVKAYNVYTQNNHLSIGEGHGTHVAALAAGSLDFLNQGAAGIAPECSIMPVQVFDDGIVPLSALISGIMYAVHQKADVVNISVGADFQGLNILPVAEQEKIAATRFKNMEKLWLRISEIASRHNSILVFAAGNDDIISAIPPENRNGISIAVGAVDKNLYPTEFTNYGPMTDISAPGQSIMSAMPGGKLGMGDGTSMAAPIVTGVVALMKSLKKDITAEQALNVMFRTGVSVYGNMPPMVQINLALEAVKKGDFSAPAPRPIIPVPVNEIQIPGIYDGVPPSSWTEPVPEEIVVRPILLPGEGYPGGPVTGVDYPVGGSYPYPVDGTVPVNAEYPVSPGYPTEPAYPGYPTTPGVTPPANTQPGVPGAPGTTNPAQPGQTQVDDDYEAIRKAIEAHKKKIAELEKLLPENQSRR